MGDFWRVIRQPRFLALGDQCVISCSNFVSVLILGRNLKVDEFGFFSLAMLTVIFISNLHRAFVTQPLNVLGADEDELRLATRMTVLLSTHVLLVPAAIFLLVCVSVMFYPRMEMTAAAAIYLTASLLQETVRRYWYTVGRLDRAILTDGLSYGAQILVLFIAQWVVVLEAPLAFLLMAGCAFSGLLVGLIGIKRVGLAGMGDFRTVVSEHWKLSRWLILTVLALWASSQLYPFLIVKLGPVAVAWFAVTRNLLSAMHVVVQSVVNYLPSRAAFLLKTEGVEVFRRHAIRTSLHAALAAIVFILAMQLLALPILHLLYGGIYDPAQWVLRIFAVGMLFSLVGAVLGCYSLAMHDSRSTFLANLGSAVFTFTGGLWLIKEYGVYGATIAGCLSLAVATILQAGFFMAGIGRLSNTSLRARGADAVADL